MIGHAHGELQFLGDPFIVNWPWTIFLEHTNRSMTRQWLLKPAECAFPIVIFFYKAVLITRLLQ